MSASKCLTRISARFQLTRTSFNSKCVQVDDHCGNHGKSPLLVQLSGRFIHSGNKKHGRHLSDPANTGRVQRGVNFDTLGSWNNRLDLSISVEKSIEKGRLIPEIPFDEIGTASLIGRRKVNEDRFRVSKLSEDLLYFAIFDGHAGSFAVDFVHTTLEHHLQFWLHRTRNLFDVLHNSFIDVNNLLSRHMSYYHQDVDNHTGTTATVCLLRNNIELVVGHVGDTRAILCRGGEAIRLTKDHSPDDKDEVKRIKGSGGHISENSLGVPHVNGRLTMTRSIGDVELKSFGVIAEPYLRSIEVKHGKDAFLVLISDGLSFVLSDQELADIITSCSNPSEAAFFITDQALHFGSQDNATAVIVPFGAWGKYRSTPRSIPYSFGRNLSSNTGRFS